MLVNKSSTKLHEDIKINSKMTSCECYENKWFYMKYI